MPTFEEEIGLTPSAPAGDFKSLEGVDIGLSNERPNQAGVSEVDAQLGMAEPSTEGAYQGYINKLETRLNEPQVIEPKAPITERAPAVVETARRFAAVPATVGIGLLKGLGETLSPLPATSEQMVFARSKQLENAALPTLFPAIRQAFNKGTENLAAFGIDFGKMIGLVPTMEDIGPLRELALKGDLAAAAKVKEFDTAFPQGSGDTQTAQPLGYLDLPRVAAIDAAMAALPPESRGSGLVNAVPAVMDAAVALGDFTLFNEWARAASKSVKEISAAKDRPVQLASDGKGTLGNTLLQVLAETPAEFINPMLAENVPGLIPVESVLLASSKILPKMLSSSEKLVDPVIRAFGGKNSYKAAVEFANKEVIRRGYRHLEKLPPGTYSNPSTTKQMADTMDDVNQAILTPTSPSGIKRLAEIAGIKFKENIGQPLAKFAADVRLAADKDTGELVMNDLRDAVEDMTHAKNYGRGVAAFDVHNRLDQALFPDLKWDISDQFPDQLGGPTLVKNAVLGRTALGIDKVTIRDWAKLSQVSESDMSKMVDDFLLNKPVPNPRMYDTYWEAGRFIDRIGDWYPELQDKFNRYAVQELEKAGMQVNPLAAPGRLERDTITNFLQNGDKEAGIKAISDARSKAWERAWGEFAHVDPTTGRWKITEDEGLLGPGTFTHYMTTAYDEQSLDDVLKAVNHYNKEILGYVEPMKLKNFDSYTIREGMYLHNMYNDNAGRLTGANAGILGGRKPGVMTPGSAFERRGRIAETEREYNIRALLEKDLTELHAKALHNRAFKKIMDRGIKRQIPGQHKTGADGYMYEKRGVPDEFGNETEQWVKTNFREMPLIGLDKMTIKAMPFMDPKALEQGIGRKIMNVLDGGESINSSEDIFKDVLSAEDFKKLPAIIQKNTYYAREDVHAYIEQMRPQQKSLHKQSNKKLDESGDFSVPAAESASQGYGKFNALLKPIQVNVDAIGIGQRLLIDTPFGGSIWYTGGPKFYIDVLKKRGNMLPNEFQEAIAEGLRSGAVSWRNGHMTELSGAELEDARSAGDKLAFFSRWAGAGDRAMYRRSIDNPGYDLKTRSAIIHTLRVNGEQFIDDMYRDNFVGPVWKHLLDFGKKMAGPDFAKMFRNVDEGIPSEQKVRALVERMAGSFDIDRMNSSQKRFTSNLVPFYGWGKGYLTGLMSMPIRNPKTAVTAFAGGLYAMDTLNVVLSGHHMWENPQGRKTEIQYNPALMSYRARQLLYKDPGAEAALEDPRHSMFIKMPGLTRAMKLFQAETIYDHFAAKRAGVPREAFSTVAHVVSGIVYNGFRTGVLNRFVPLNDANAALELLENYKDREMDEATSAAIQTGLDKINLTLGGIYKNARAKNWQNDADFWAINAMTAGGALLGVNMDAFQVGRGKMGAQRSLRGTEGEMPSPEALQDYITQALVNKEGSSIGNRPANLLRNNMVRDMINDQTTNPEERAQAFNTWKQNQGMMGR